MPCDDLHCALPKHPAWPDAPGPVFLDKVSRCVELEIDVLVDDSPVNIARAQEQGIVAATILHPWNEDLVERDGVIGARDWPGLRRRLDPVLDRIG
jgi:hypothetical protein